MISVVANAFVIYVEYFNHKEVKKLHVLLICVPIFDIIFALTAHMMITLTSFGIYPEIFYSKYGWLL